MTNEMQNGPLVALVLALSNEMVDILLEAGSALTEAGELDLAMDTSAKLEKLCMLRSLVAMSAGQSAVSVSAPSVPQEIMSYLQERDAAVFPINIREDGKYVHLDTAEAVSFDTAKWLDMNFPDKNIVLNHAARAPAVSVFHATRNPGFIAERQEQPVQPNASAPHNPRINSGMPMAGEMQGMPGGRIGDK